MNQINDIQHGTESNPWVRGHATWQLGFLHTYPITMTLGIICSFLAVAYFWKKQKYSWEVLQILVILIIPGSIIGARLWFLISEGGWENWYKLSGLSIQGGVMGALIAGLPYLYSVRHKVDPRTVLGIIVPNVILGQAIGRWGNFDNHEVYGRLISTDYADSTLDWMGWMKHHMWIANTEGGIAGYRQPLFLYEFMTSVIGWTMMVLVLLRKNWVKPGVTAGIYLLWYGIVRISMEPLRDPVDIMKWGSVPISEVVAGLSIVGGLFFIGWWQFFTGISKESKVARYLASKNNRFMGFLYKLATWNYDLIKPVKERRLWWVGPKSDKKLKYLFFGEEVENRVNIWLPSDAEERWSKREINKGKKKSVFERNKSKTKEKK